MPRTGALAATAARPRHRRAEWPALDGDDWRGYLAGHADVTWGLLAADPALAAEAADVATPVQVVHIDGMVRALVSIGFTREAALLAADLVLDLVQDVFIRSQALLPPPESGDNAEWLTDLDSDLRPVVAEALRNPRSWFDRKLAVVLDGIDAALVPRS